MNKRIKKKHYDLKCESEIDSGICVDFNIGKCCNNIRTQRKCPYYLPYKKAKRWWKKSIQYGMEIYLKGCLKGNES